MPFINVKSLPLDNDLDVPATIKKISQDFSDTTQIDLKHITVTWEFIPADHYAVDGKTQMRQSTDSHPILIDLLVPSFNTPESVGNMLRCIADSINTHTHIPRQNIFINTRYALSGHVFDRNEVLFW